MGILRCQWSRRQEHKIGVVDEVHVTFIFFEANDPEAKTHCLVSVSLILL